MESFNYVIKREGNQVVLKIDASNRKDSTPELDEDMLQHVHTILDEYVRKVLVA